MNKTLLLILVFAMLIIAGCSSNDNRTFGSGITPTPTPIPLANVSAKLVNPLLNSPVANAEVKVTYSHGQVVKAVTDANGFFNIDIEAIPGQVNIEISKPNYLVEQFIVTVNNDGTLSYNDIINASVLLNASGVAYEIETVSGMEFLSGKYITRSVLSPDEKYLYTVDMGNNCIYRINLQDKTYKVIETLYSSPMAIAVTKDGGTIYVGYQSNPVSKITNIDGTPNEFIVAGVNGSQGDVDDGHAAQPCFFSIEGMALTKDGDTLYVCDTNTNKVKKITGLLTAQDASEVHVTTITSYFAQPISLCLSPDENSLYVVNFSSTIGSIKGVKDSLTPEVTILAGMTGILDYADGDGNDARFKNPMGIFTNDGSVLFVADVNNCRIRKIAQSAGEVSVTTIAGTGTSAITDGDGLTEATFKSALDITINADGTIAYITDFGNNIRRMVAKEK